MVSGVECVLIAHDPTVRGGSVNPYSLRKSLRALEIARCNRLPVINLVESGGADLPSQSELFVPGGKTFHDLTELSAMGVPTIALVFGNSTAGGAYVPAMCDYSVLVDGQAKVFLGGPPLVKMATGEDADDEELGGARMHAQVSGLADYFAADERDAIRLGRRIMAELNWRKQGPPPSLPADEPAYDPDELLGIAPADIRVPFDPREVLARVVDGSRFGEYKPSYGTSLVTGWASVHGYPVGVLANARGVLFSEESKKAAEFIQLANQADTPLLFLQNTTGYMVGTSYEQGGIIKDGAKMINAVTNSTVPHITLNMAASFGAGNYGMSGRAYRPAADVRLARLPAGGDGRRPARRGAVDRGQGGGAVGGPPVRRRGRRAAQAGDRGADRPGVARLLRDGPALRRRPDRPARHADGAGHRAVGGAFRAGAGAPRLRRLPDVMPVPAITRLLIANRGEIALRIIRTAREMDIATVAVFSDPDAGAPYVRAADEAVRLPGAAPRDTYLRGDAIIAAAAAAGADAVHPGYGFLAENAGFARDCAAAGLTFVGPPPAVIEAMGSKLAARDLLAAAGVPVLPGLPVPAETAGPAEAEKLAGAAAEIGYPVLVKAAFGGGGRGMRIVRAPAELAEAVESAAREAASAFGDGTVFIERYLEAPRHIEVQIIGDAHGTVVHLFERECSVQRRYQKIIEESPSPGGRRAAARRARRDRGPRRAGHRLRRRRDRGVRHGPGRLVLVPGGEHPAPGGAPGHRAGHRPGPGAAAAGDRRGSAAPAGGDRGAAGRARDRGQDLRGGPAGRLRPAAGVLHRFAVPGLPGVRTDAGVADGSVVGVHYDSMLAKVIAHGPTRDAARRRLARALAEAQLHGVTTNRDLLVAVLREADFAAGRIDTGYLSGHPALLDAGRLGGLARDLHLAAAALAGQAERRAAARVLAAAPSGWRNVRSEDQHAEYLLDGERHEVRYRIGRDGLRVSVGGRPLPGAELGATTADEVELTAGGVTRRFAVHRVGHAVYVDSTLGSVALTEAERFPEPDAMAVAGSLRAPLPGTVVRVAAEVGQRVDAGDPIVILEAMKMEHVVASPGHGVVAEVAVRPGQTVEAGAELARLT